MSVMGLSRDQQNYAMMIVAGVLHIGNIDFVERNNYAEIADKQCQSIITVCFLYVSKWFTKMIKHVEMRTCIKHKRAPACLLGYYMTLHTSLVSALTD